MSGSHRGRPRGSLRLLSLLAVMGLALATAPAHASPLTPPPPHDAPTAVGAGGPDRSSTSTPSWDTRARSAPEPAS